MAETPKNVAELDEMRANAACDHAGLPLHHALNYLPMVRAVRELTSDGGRTDQPQPSGSEVPK